MTPVSPDQIQLMSLPTLSEVVILEVMPEKHESVPRTQYECCKILQEI